MYKDTSTERLFVSTKPTQGNCRILLLHCQRKVSQEDALRRE